MNDSAPAEWFALMLCFMICDHRSDSKIYMPGACNRDMLSLALCI